MTLETGVRLGPYEILSPLDVAGIGEVYCGRDHEHGRDVVIRVLRIDVAADPTLLSRLQRNVLAAAALTHPNILDVYDVGTGQHELYVVSEPFEGATLRALLDRGELPVRSAIGCAVRVARALAAAHWKGIAHGDVRSENVLLTPGGRAIVLGFGLTAVTRADSSSDVFAFAAMCREVITGALSRGALPERRRRLARVAVFGLLALVVGFALPVTRYVQRARQNAQTTRVAAGESAPSATPSSPATVVPTADPPVEPVARLFEAATEEGSIEEIAVSDEVPVTIAEAEEADAEAGASIQEEASSEGEGVPPDGDAARDVVAGVAGNGSLPLAIADATVSELPPRPSPLPPPLPEPSPPRDGRDARSLITEALVRATEFDLPGASDLLRVTADRGDRGAEVALVYIRGLIDAREAFRDGGTVASLAPVQAAIASLEAIAQGRRGSAEIARLVLQAAAAAAQSERDEMRLYLEAAIQMELVQNAAGLPGAPLVSATETAGDLWLRVGRYDDARRSYTEAAERAGSSLRILAGLARAASRLKDFAAACASYGSLLNTWGARPGQPVEIAEARAYLDDSCAPAGP